MRKSILVLIMIMFSVTSFARGILYYESFFEKDTKNIKREIEKLERLNSSDSDYKLGVLYSALSVNDPEEKGASKRAKKYMEKYLKGDKENPLAMTYYAMSLSLVARDHWNPIVKMLSMKKCFKYFDRAVELAKKKRSKDLYYIRFLRSNTYLNIPDMFNKSEEAKEDLIYLEQNYRDSYIRVSKGALVGVYYNLGEISKTDGNINRAIEYWDFAVDFANENQISSDQKRLAQRQLDIFKTE